MRRGHPRDVHLCGCRVFSDVENGGRIDKPADCTVEPNEERLEQTRIFFAFINVMNNSMENSMSNKKSRIVETMYWQQGIDMFQLFNQAIESGI